MYHNGTMNCIRCETRVVNFQTNTPTPVSLFDAIPLNLFAGSSHSSEIAQFYVPEALSLARVSGPSSPLVGPTRRWHGN
jgi:hypothetical protein